MKTGAIQADGFPAGVGRIKRLRQEMNLRCEQKRKFKATTDSRHSLPVAPDLLDRQFAVTDSNKAWVAT